MSGGDNADLIDRWKVLAEAEPNPRRKGELGGLALVFAEKTGCRELWEQKLEGWNVEESTIVNRWIARGEEIGKEISILEEARATILKLGTKRFGPPAQEVRDTVLGLADRGRLERIIDRIFDATSWDDLLGTA